jgi:hypothetical protein
MKYNQLFQIGEVVLLDCKLFPYLNGEYQVLAAVAPMQYYSWWTNHTQSYAYDLGLWTDAWAKQGTTMFHESALRKKFKPSTFSFKEMKRSLMTIPNSFIGAL